MLEARIQRKILFNTMADMDDYLKAFDRKRTEYTVDRVTEIKHKNALSSYEAIISTQYNYAKLLREEEK